MPRSALENEEAKQAQMEAVKGAGYIQMSSMILGGMIEADNGMRRFEHQIRVQRMVARDRAMWKDLVDDEDDELRPTSMGTSSAPKK
ncbi:hypothetical protein NPX13_g6250 [Xylaria arbuscula]|uniref:Uncharacterized protein n=1 Tax=Xylaria arbuscula TaxID=114810 RepID=A0A9W8NC73_9PEZI|nr:hypothetical protein NPX13_g6250 [Xylaria arbuscula]